MNFGKVPAQQHVTTDDLRTVKEFQKLTEPEAERLLKQIKEFSNMIYTFTLKQDNE